MRKWEERTQGLHLIAISFLIQQMIMQVVYAIGIFPEEVMSYWVIVDMVGLVIIVMAYVYCHIGFNIAYNNFMKNSLLGDMRSKWEKNPLSILF